MGALSNIGGRSGGRGRRIARRLGRDDKTATQANYDSNLFPSERSFHFRRKKCSKMVLKINWSRGLLGDENVNLEDNIPLRLCHTIPKSFSVSSEQ